MKIIFLCGSLEPGRDGVGDYTRRLAGELKEQGHQVAAVALNDRYCTETLDGQQYSEGNSISVFRLSAKLQEKKRFHQAKTWIDRFEPEWISLQFVPFSFHPKGLNFKLSVYLAEIIKDRSFHIMFHELWVGMDKEAPLKHVLWGRLQQYIISALLRSLRPEVIHTHTQLYKYQLNKIGYQSLLLPLFGNISVNANKNIKLRDIRNIITSKKAVTLVLFGGIQPNAPIEEFSKDVASFKKSNSIDVALVLIGRCGVELERWVKVWRDEDLTVEVLGEQEPEKISEVLKDATLGISTTPLYQIEKSGTVAAMREHGLPVLCVSRPWHPRRVKRLRVPSGIVEYQDQDFATCLVNLREPFKVNNSVDVAHRMASDLSLKI